MSGRILRAAIAALAAGAIGAAPAAAQSFAVTPSGYLTASAYATPCQDELLSAAGLRGALNLDGWLPGEIQFRISGEAYMNLAGLSGDTASAGADWYAPGAGEWRWNDRLLADLSLKEAWLGFAAGPFDVVAGNQLVTWGQADGTNPTDNVNPRYVGTRSVSASAEKKIGVPMLNLTWNLPGDAGSIQGLFLPVSVGNRMPASDYLKVTEPAIAPENMEGGVRALFYPGSFSISASWLTVLDRYPSDAVETAKLPMPPFDTIPVRFGRTRQHIVGFDAAYTLSGYDLRTEWAWFITDDAACADPYARNPYVSGVVQASRSFFNSTTSVALSWAPTVIIGFEEPAVPVSMPFLANLFIGQGFPVENMLGLRVQSKLMNETLQPEGMFLAALAARDWYANAAVSYNIADGWNLKAGMNLYGSFRADDDPERQFGTFGNDSTRDGDSFYLELRFDF